MSTTCDPSQLIRNLQGPIRQKAIRAATRGLTKAAHHVIGQAQQLAPQSPSQQFIPGVRKDQIQNPGWTGTTGFLRDSAKVDPAVTSGDDVSIQFGFTAVYAAAQHERLDYRHTTGQAKYLETALRANLPQVPQRIVDEMKKEGF